MIIEEFHTDLAAAPVSADEGDRPGAPIIGLIGGRGGAGASVIAAALARAAVDARYECVLVDADPLGGGADLLLGAEDEPGLRWPDLSAARGRLAPGVLLAGLPVIDGVHVVSWDRVTWTRSVLKRFRQSSGAPPPRWTWSSSTSRGRSIRCA